MYAYMYIYIYIHIHIYIYIHIHTCREPFKNPASEVLPRICRQIRRMPSQMLGSCRKLGLGFRAHTLLHFEVILNMNRGMFLI